MLCENLHAVYRSNNELNEQLKKIDEIRGLYAEILTERDIAFISELIDLPKIEKDLE